jgi:hypothetical protein
MAKGKAPRPPVELRRQGAAANKAIVGLRSAELAVASARSKLDAATKALDVVKTPEAAERAKAVVQPREAALASRPRPRKRRAPRKPPQRPKRCAARAGLGRRERQPDRGRRRQGCRARTDPISIFISKKTNRLYIRQAWAPIHEVAVTIKEPDALIGTHTYLAVEPAADSKSLRWLSVTFPAASAKPARRDDDDDETTTVRGRGRASPPSRRRRAGPAARDGCGRARAHRHARETRQFISERSGRSLDHHLRSGHEQRDRHLYRLHRAAPLIRCTTDRVRLGRAWERLSRQFRKAAL